MKFDKENGVVVYTTNEYLLTLKADEVRMYWHSVVRTLRALFIDRYAFRNSLRIARLMPDYPALSLERIYLNLLIVNDQIKVYRDILYKIRRYAQHKHIQIK